LIEKNNTLRERKPAYARDAGVRSRKTANLPIVMNAVSITETTTGKYLTQSKRFAEKGTLPEKQKTSAPAAECL